MNLKPLFNRIIVKRDTPEEMTKSGIIIPIKAQEKQLLGTVIKSGPDVKYVKEGDRILFEKYSGDDLELEGIQYLIITEESIIGIETK